MNFENNESHHRFEYTVDGAIAYIAYKRSDNIFTMTHTEVPEVLGGKGIGKELVEATLNYLKENNHQLIPLCPFVIAYLKRNPEWKSLLAKGYIVK